MPRMRAPDGGCLYGGPAMPYEVQTSVFEGPFDLLLHLILREQVDLYEISLSRIVDGYLAELEKLDEFDLEIATEFLLIAATLGRAEDQAAAARRSRHRSRRRAGPVGRARSPARPAARLQDVQGRGQGARGVGRRRLAFVPPPRRARGSLPRSGARSPRGSHGRAAPCRVPPGDGTQAGTDGRHRAPGRHSGQRHRRRRRAHRRVAAARPRHVPRAHRRRSSTASTSSCGSSPCSSSTSRV